MERLIGKSVVWARSQSDFVNCFITNIEQGRRVAEIQLCEKNTKEHILNVLVSLVDDNHLEDDLLNQCFVVHKQNKDLPQNEINMHITNYGSETALGTVSPLADFLSVNLNNIDEVSLV